MSEHFNPQTILELAFKVKENSAELYAALEQKATNSDLNNFWSYLKQDSQMHYKVFQEMHANPEAYVIYELGLKEYDQYLNEITPSFRYAVEAVVQKTKKLFKSDLEAIEFVIYVTIESILAYSALKDYIMPLKLDIFNKIIGDEKKHLAKLNLIKRKLMA